MSILHLTPMATNAQLQTTDEMSNAIVAPATITINKSKSKMNIKSRALDDFLKSHQCKKGSKEEKGPTHTRIGGEKGSDIYGGSYHIPDDEYDTFMQLYFNEVVSKNALEYLTEKQMTPGKCIAVDLDLHFSYETEERVYTKDEMGDLIHWYLEELKTMYQFDGDTKFQVYLFEKITVNRVQEKNITKDGIHLIIGIQMDHAAQCILRQKMITRISKEWADLPIVNTWEDVFDKGISNGYTNWQLYGSRKPNHLAYQLSQVWDYSYDPSDGEMSATSIDLDVFLTAENFPKLSVRYQNHPQFFYKTAFAQTLATAIDAASSSERRRNDIPSPFIGMDGDNHLQNLRAISSIRNEEDMEMHINRFLDSIDTKEYILREVYEYVMILPESYYGVGSYAKWIRVGWALKNMTERLLIVWIKFCARATTFQYSDIPGLCDKWDSEFLRKCDGVTDRSIMYWAMQDNYEGFKQVKQNTVSNLLDQTINSISIDTLIQDGKNTKGCGDYDIARVLYELYKFEYKCISVKNNIWYRFRNHRWIEIDSGTTLRRAISDTLRDLYQDKANQIMQFASTIDVDEERHKILKARTGMILNICRRLGCTNDKKNIMTEARDLFHDSEFMKRIDNNPLLLCFSNGVYDFSEKNFRKGIPKIILQNVLIANITQ